MVRRLHKWQTLVVSLLCCIAIVCGIGVASFSASATTGDGLIVPSEFFGAFAPFTVGEDTYTNYNHGYTRSRGGKIVEMVGHKNAKDDGTPIFIAMDYANDTYNVNAIGAILPAPDNAGIITNIENAAGKTVAEVRTNMIAKFKSVTESGYNVGLARGRLEIWDGVIEFNFGYGDGITDNKYGYKNASMLAYNPTMVQTFLVNELLATWIDGITLYGAPCSDIVTSILDNGETKTYKKAQKFDKGYFYSTDGIIFTFKASQYDYVNNCYGTAKAVITPPDAFQEYFGAQDINYIVKTNKTYINYENGYVVANGTAPNYTYEYHYGYTINSELVTSMVNATTLVNLQRNGIDGDISSIVPVAEQAALQAKFKKAYVDSCNAGSVPGLTATGIYAFNGTVIQNYWFGESGAKESYLAYGPIADETFYLNDYSATWLGQANSLGAPVSNIGARTFKIEGIDTSFAKCQMFEKGYIYTEDSEVKFEIISYVNGGYQTTINPSEAYAQYFGAQDSNYIVKGNTTYVNYENGYVKVSTKAKPYTYEYHYGYTIDIELKESMVDATALANLQRSDFEASITESIVPEAERAALQAKFKQAYIDSCNNGKVPGLSATGIYVFNGTVIQNYWHGNSDSREGYMAYDKTEKEVHYIAEFSVSWLSMAATLGAPTTDVMVDKQVTLTNKSKVTYSKIIVFEKGYIFTANNKNTIMIGYKYDSATSTFSKAANVPSNYGNMIGNTIEINGKLCYNYEHGAVRESNVNGDITFEYFGARNFAEDGTIIWENISYYNGLINDVTIAGLYNDEQKVAIKKLVSDRFASMYGEGIFAGFPDREIQVWDGIFGLQFYFADSTANPFNEYDARRNVLMMSINVKANELVVLKDDMLVMWSKLKNQPFWSIALGAPTKEMIVDGKYTYQQFGDKIAISINGNRESYAITKLTFAQWKAEQEKESNPSHGQDVDNGYIGDTMNVTKEKGCSSSAATSAPIAMLAMLGLVMVTFVIKKKA